MGLAVIGALAAAVLWAWGMRGRYVGASWCRACRRELVDAASSSQRCPHCDADLGIEHAVGVGRRVRRPVAVGLGLVCAWLAASIGAAGTMRWAQGVDWQAYKPVGLLLSQANSADSDTTTSALSELLRRIEAGQLDRATRDRFSDLVITRVMPNGWSLTSRWEPIVVQDWIDGQLSQAQSIALAQHLASVSLNVPREATHSQSFLSLGVIATSSLGSTDTPMLISLTPIDVSIDGDAQRTWITSNESNLRSSGGSSGSSYLAILAMLASAGQHSLTVRCQVDVQVVGNSATAVSWTASPTIDLDVAAPDDNALDIRVDEIASQQVRDAVQFEVVGLRGADPATGNDLLLGALNVNPDQLRADMQVEVWIGSRLLTSDYRLRSAPFSLPLLDGESQAPVKVVLNAYPRLRHPGPDGFHEDRPIWFGPPVTIVREAIEWFDSLDDPALPDAIRAQHFDGQLERQRRRLNSRSSAPAGDRSGSGGP